ncbi:OmpA family protein [Niveispirillum cyanobacteriorum]|uniref:Cell envelope biogenesis protein OmpA n=1 Tax=Niveispirillum cyanobacteriorum TaxID=1612173 RepID=A0A2K9N7Y3_9PROT|nr:OmpA family protein [Niveispirillum cyanobacteriorum]AUN29194.1 cell envelope biogenesis protein OmpA [Niveispirillum cyanobacteriorum]GGE66578.1 membrane protein [Niveispirillum cyanobacteriorum]
MKLHHLLMGTALALVLPVAATAQTLPEGPYIGSQIGVSWLQDLDLKTATATNKVNNKETIAAVFETGYQFGDGLRLGVEGGYSIHQVDTIKGGPVGNPIGDTTTFTLMGVVQKEFDVGSPFRPYVSAGLGWGWVDTDNVGPVFSNGYYSNAAQDNFAYQLGVGVAYALTPDLDLTFGYRYQGIDDLKFKSENPRYKSNYNSHSVLIGVRTVFGSAPAQPVQATTVVAPPPPPPAPAPAPAPAAAPTITRNFTVFFDWDRSVLSADAQQVLQNVARDAKAGKIVQINVAGHADTSGPTDYNQKLSQRRAEAVREYLVSQGLPANQVSVEAKGEADLLVPTADGVREPSNRRAVIVFP